MLRNPLSLVTLALLASAASCGGAAGEAIRPKDQTAEAALGRPKVACQGPGKKGILYVVDLDPSTRTDLEAAMKRGVAVVAYDCVSLRVLNGCRVPEATYDYVGVSRKETVVQWSSADEVRANLPVSNGKIDAEMKSGRSIDLATVSVGSSSTTLGAITQADLTGSCEGATHVIQGASLGAFAMATGSVGKVSTVAEMFTVGGAGKSDSERKAMNKDGSLDACRKSDPDAKAAPAECRAALQIELSPILASASAAASAEPTKKADGKKGGAKPAPEKGAKVAVVENPCPEGFDFVSGSCVRAGAKAKLCDPKDEADCKAQCDKGDPGSCVNYGKLARKKGGNGAALPAYKKACDAGFAEGCGALADAMVPDVDAPDVAAAAKATLKIANQGCAGGSDLACTVAADLYLDAVYKIADPAAGLKAYERGCSLGGGDACYGAAVELLTGKRVPRDVERGVGLLGKSCLAGNADNCFSLAKIHALGSAYGSSEGLVVNADKAYAAYRRACTLDVETCGEAATMLTKIGRQADGLKLAERGCNGNDEDACQILGKAFETGAGVPQDAAKAKDLYTKACKGGSGNEVACKKIGVKPKW